MGNWRQATCSWREIISGSTGQSDVFVRKPWPVLHSVTAASTPRHSTPVSRTVPGSDGSALVLPSVRWCIRELEQTVQSYDRGRESVVEQDSTGGYTLVIVTELEVQLYIYRCCMGGRVTMAASLHMLFG